MPDSSGTNTSFPAANVNETENDFQIEIAAPGMKNEDFRICFHNYIMTISSEKKDEKEEKNETCSRREFSYQSFQRSFLAMENAADSGKITVVYSNGILVIRLPKRDEVNPKQAIDIKQTKSFRG